MEEFYKYFWLFMIGSAIGFLCETVWCIIKNKRVESRKGLIYGHYTPVYGISAMLIIFIAEKLSIDSLITIFFLTFIVSSFVEYISSFFQEKAFGTVSWDYSDMKYNINGRINLKYSFMWGTLGVIWYKYYLQILEILFFILNTFGLFEQITKIGIIFMLYNCIISISALYRQKLRRNGIKATNFIERWLDKKYTDEFLAEVYENSKIV